MVETSPRCCTKGRALLRDLGDIQSIKHKLSYLAMNSDPRLLYQYLCFSLTLLSNSEEYCKQRRIELPEVINKAVYLGTQ